MSLVRMESGAVNWGVLDRSSLLFLAFLGLLMGDMDILVDLLVLNGESDLLVVRPLLVRTPSLGLGVGGL